MKRFCTIVHRKALFLLMLTAFGTSHAERVNELVADGDRLYALSGSQIHVSQDEGASWALLNEFDSQVLSFAVHPGDPNHLFAGTYDWISYSTDGGQTWTQAAGFEEQQPGSYYEGSWNQVNSILVTDEEEPRLYLAGVLRGVYTSTDLGLTWNQVDHVFDLPVGLIKDPLDSSTVYVYAEYDGDLIRTVDDGNSWQKMSTPVRVNSTAIDPHDSSRILVAGYLFNPGEDIFYHSSDSGLNWTQASTPLPDLHVADIVFDPKNSVRVYSALRTVPSFGMESEWPIYVSTDGGMSWQPIPEAPVTSGLSLHVSNENEILVLGSDEGIWRSTDGGSNWMLVWPDNSADTDENTDSESGVPDISSGGGSIFWLLLGVICIVSNAAGTAVRK